MAQKLKCLAEAPRIMSQTEDQDQPVERLSAVYVVVGGGVNGQCEHITPHSYTHYTDSPVIYFSISVLHDVGNLAVCILESRGEEDPKCLYRSGGCSLGD